MKKFLKLTIVALSLTLFSSMAPEETFANSNIKINVSGREVYSDVAPFSLHGRTMVPIRFVSEALGANVSWSGEEQAITIERPYTKELYITLGNAMQNSMSASIYEDGGYYGYNSYSIYLDVAPVVRNERTFLPARIIAEELGYYVSWDENTNTVIISEEYLGGQTYKDYLDEQNTDPYEWSPLLKGQFEAEMVEQGYANSTNEIRYERSDVIDGEGHYTVYSKLNGQYVYVVGVNAKTGDYHG